MSLISYGEAKLSDALRISILLKTVYIQAYALNGITFEFANFITKRFSEEYIKNAIQENPDQFIVAYKNDNPVGVAEVFYKGNCPVRKTEVPELSKLYVLERFYGQGIGAELLKRAEKKVVEKGLDELNLIVWIRNPRAIAFYKKQGYEVLAEVDFPMETNTYKNFAMNKVLV